MTLITVLGIKTSMFEIWKGSNLWSTTCCVCDEPFVESGGFVLVADDPNSFGQSSFRGFAHRTCAHQKSNT